MNKNSENPSVGKTFQEEVLAIASERFDCAFNLETAIGIGNPQRPHKFDVVSNDGKIIIECKCYTWTDGGNVPSAKIATFDEAILYMLSVPYEAEKVIALKKDIHKKKGLSLAEYIFEKKRHLLRDIQIWEVDGNSIKVFCN